MFDTVQLLCLGAAAVIDTVLLLALLERRNWGYVMLPVVARRVAADGVHYRCTGLAGERSLSVRPRDDGGAECLWQTPNAEVRLPPDELRVFGVAGTAPMSS